MPIALVRSASLTGYAELARSIGLDPFAQLRQAEIDPACLNNPDLKLPVVKLHRLLEASAAAARIEDFGLRLAMSRRTSNLGLIALAAREEPTVRDALACLQRTMYLHNDAIRVLIEEDNEVVVIQEQFMARVQGEMRQAVELSTGVLFRLAREFMGDAWSPKAVCFIHDAPRDLSNYRKLFGTAVQFNSVLNGLTCRRSDLDRPMPGADPESLRTIQKYVQAAAEQQASQRERTTHLILGLLPTGRCTADRVASYIGIDRRTLHRWLDAESTSFSQLMDEVRQEVALRHLANPQLAVADLAPTLGFSEPSAFSRWFSGKFGCSPRQWRATRRTGSA
jgi:AraC-like DNA-binding protein